ncbi:MAG: protein-L-isoaspartate(D-aspartate) O-methyltransferase [Bacteroidetes bacterium]|nr:protein-L-isoaspartate(D-aspartate) O-methyltransferase [Bacteroidota bacterium]
MEDNYKHKGIRKQLVALLQTKGIKNTLVLSAIEAIPRHLFLDSSFLEFAYQDKAFPIGEGQTISQPYTVAFQTELLDIKKGEKVLEVGTGSGYQTAVLCFLGAKVFSIERQKNLYDKTKLFLPKLGYNAKFFYGDGYKGLPPFAPYDKILVTAGAPLIPTALLEQLKEGGKLVIPVGVGKVQEMYSLVKCKNNFEQTNHGSFKFVPLLEQKA